MQKRNKQEGTVDYTISIYANRILKPNYKPSSADTYFVVVVNFHHVPLAVTDTTKDVRRHCRFRLTWETIKEKHYVHLLYENKKLFIMS